MEETKVYRMKKDYRFRFGKYEAKRVDEVLAKGIYGKDYLVWIYANKEDLDFTDDILEEVGLTERIAKPGRKPELFEAWHDALPQGAKDALERDRMGKWNKNQAVRRKVSFVTTVRGNYRDRAVSDKGALAWKNQGH